jgi:ribosome-binding protein aMBF1 (putative translation factor)
MKDDRFYVDDVPLARNMDEFPPKQRPKKPLDARYATGPIIARMRRRRGLTQHELSRRIGRTQTYIGALESKHESCRYDTLAKIARACGYKIIIVTEEKWSEYEQAYHTWQISKRSGAR